jgi:hypothetical protein
VTFSYNIYKGSYVGNFLQYIDTTTYAAYNYGLIVGISNTGNGTVNSGLTLTNNVCSVGAYSPIITFGSRSNTSTYNVTYAAIYGVYQGVGSSADWAKGDIIFATAPDNGTVERMRIKYDGKVGIGASAPISKLHVNTAGSTDSFITIGNNNGGTLIGINAAGTESRIASYTGSDLVYGSNWSTTFAEKFRVGATSGNGTFTGTCTATAFYNSSDVTLKNIISRDGDVVYFNWKDGRDNLLHIGYIAQEMLSVYPNQVSGVEGSYSVNYTEILVDKVRRLEHRIEELEKTLLS